MRRLVVSANITLDGFIAGPNGELDWHYANWNDEMAACCYEELQAAEIILTGRISYEAMANYWPATSLDIQASAHDRKYAELMNTKTKVVLSNTLKTADWNNSRLLANNVAHKINEMKSQEGGDILSWGGIKTLRTLMQAQLVDEYKLWVAPIVLGKGAQLFDTTTDSFDLQLNSVRNFSNGVVLLCYQTS